MDTPRHSPVPARAVTDSAPVTSRPGQPNSSGYAEPKPAETRARDRPVPEAAGGEASQVAGRAPDEGPEAPDDDEPTPPGEHKREPIKDPDPADTKLHA